MSDNDTASALPNAGSFRCSARCAARAARPPLAPAISLHKVMQRKSTIAFLMALPLILLIALLVVYPALYSLYLRR